MEYVYRVVGGNDCPVYTRQSNSHPALYAQEHTAKAQATRLNSEWTYGQMPPAPFRAQRASVNWEDLDV